MRTHASAKKSKSKFALGTCLGSVAFGPSNPSGAPPEEDLRDRHVDDLLEVRQLQRGGGDWEREEPRHDVHHAQDLAAVHLRLPLAATRDRELEGRDGVGPRVESLATESAASVVRKIPKFSCLMIKIFPYF